MKAPFLRSIVNDARGRLYLASEAGLLQYDPETGVVRHFHVRDGLPSDVVQNGVRDRTGALWFGTGRGLMRVVPEDAPTAPPRPVWIDGVSVGGVSYSGLSDRGETQLRNVRFALAAGPLKLVSIRSASPRTCGSNTALIPWTAIGVRLTLCSR